MNNFTMTRSGLLDFSSSGFIPFGLTSRSHCLVAQGMCLLPFCSHQYVYTMETRCIFTWCQTRLRIAAVRWTRSQRPPSTCVRKNPTKGFNSTGIQQPKTRNSQELNNKKMRTATYKLLFSVLCQLTEYQKVIIKSHTSTIKKETNIF